MSDGAADLKSVYVTVGDSGRGRLTAYRSLTLAKAAISQGKEGSRPHVKPFLCGFRVSSGR
jgi:hypothetical protein